LDEEEEPEDGRLVVRKAGANMDPFDRSADTTLDSLAKHCTVLHSIHEQSPLGF